MREKETSKAECAGENGEGAPTVWQSVGSAETNCRTVLAVGRTHVRSKLGYIWKTGLQFASERSSGCCTRSKTMKLQCTWNTLGTQVAFHRSVVRFCLRWRFPARKRRGPTSVVAGEDRFRDDVPSVLLRQGLIRRERIRRRRREATEFSAKVQANLRKYFERSRSVSRCLSALN